MADKRTLTLLSIIFICFIFLSTSQAFSLESVYLSNNIHFQSKNGRGGSQAHWASYANYVDSGVGHNIIPVNTKVNISQKRTFKGKGIIITILEDGKQINMEYSNRNMSMAMDEYMSTITSPEKTSLKTLSELDQKGIKEGKAYVGMSKDGVRIALGFPAQHRTPDLDSNAWTFWRNRFKTTMIEFNQSGKVSAIR